MKKTKKGFGQSEKDYKNKPLKIIVDEINSIKRDIGNLAYDLKSAKGILEKNKDLVYELAKDNLITVVFNNDSTMTGMYVKQNHYNIAIEVDGEIKVLFKHAIKCVEKAK